MTQNKQPSFEDFLTKIHTLKEDAGVDLSMSEDLSFAVMNLISLEEHFVFTGLKTNKNEYYDTAEEIRTMRKDLLKKLMPEHEGETWCISKHLLSTTMRLIEVGNKYQTDGDTAQAANMFGQAYKVYSIFWALKLKLIEGKQIVDTGKKTSTLEDLVSKLADCCKE